jgi:hypothetical protein
MNSLPSRTVLFAAAALFLVADRAPAQQPTGPDIAQMQQAMGPMMQQMATAMLEGTLVTMAKPENAERLADFTRHYYDALIKRGFTKEEALQIVIATRFPQPMTPNR